MLLARVLLAAALAVSGVVHLDLADSYDGLGEQITLGALFRAQGAVALLAAGWVVLRSRDRLPLLVALAVGAASTAAVVLSVYVRVPALGPLPELYEPVWYAKKVVAAVSAALAAALAAPLLSASRRTPVP